MTKDSLNDPLTKSNDDLWGAGGMRWHVRYAIVASVCLFLVVAINTVYMKQLNEQLYRSPPKLVGKRVFVTGAAGFIGFHLSKKLHEDGNLVIGLDSYNDYYDQELKRVRGNTLIHDYGIQVVEGNVCDMNLLKKLFETHKFTHIAHLAAQAGVRYSLENPQSYITNNLMCMTNILEVVRNFDPKIKFIYASSSSVYGRNKKVPFSETDKVEHPSNIYGATKRANEAFALVYHELFGISVTGLRFFTVYGSYGRPDMAIYLWSKSIAKDEPLRLYEKLDSLGRPVTLKRDFTFVDDIVNGIVGSLSLGADLEVFNLGNSQPEPIMNLVDYLAQGFQRRNPKIEKKPLPGADIPQTFADIRHASRKLGFQPTTNLKDGVGEFLKWYRSYYHPENIVFLYVATDEALRQWFTSRGDRNSGSLHYIVLCSNNVDSKVINQFTKLDVRFRRIDANNNPSELEIFKQYHVLLEDLVNQSPNREWMPKRVVMMPNRKISYNQITSVIESNRDVVITKSNNLMTSKSPNCLSQVNKLRGKIELSPTPIGGNALKILSLFKETFINMQGSNECFIPSLNQVLYDVPDVGFLNE